MLRVVKFTWCLQFSLYTVELANLWRFHSPDIIETCKMYTAICFPLPHPLCTPSSPERLPPTHTHTPPIDQWLTALLLVWRIDRTPSWHIAFYSWSTPLPTVAGTVTVGEGLPQWSSVLFLAFIQNNSRNLMHAYVRDTWLLVPATSRQPWGKHSEVIT